MPILHTISRDTPAASIPSGGDVILPVGTEVSITQTLGGNVTVRTGSGLYRIAREHAGAIGGYEVAAPQPEATFVGSEFGEQAVWEALRTCFDPEIPVNIVDLGLVYDLAIESTPAGGHVVEVRMTLTAPGCGMGPVIAEDARRRIAALPTVEEARVHIVWEPQWNPQMISEAGRMALGLE